MGRGGAVNAFDLYQTLAEKYPFFNFVVVFALFLNGVGVVVVVVDKMGWGGKQFRINANIRTNPSP